MIFGPDSDRRYLPDELRGRCEARDISLTAALAATGCSLVHGMAIVRWRANSSGLFVEIRGPEDGATGWLYTQQSALGGILEDGDQIDAVVTKATIRLPLPEGGGLVPQQARHTAALWPTIEYEGPVDGDATGYNYKPDHYQAVLFKCGDFYERKVAERLRNLGHQVDGPKHTGRVLITKHPAYKRKRTPDLKCARCDRTFEVKSFLKPPARIRVSHSTNRPWSRENRAGDVHAFACEDEVIYVANEVIEQRWDEGRPSKRSGDLYWEFAKGAVQVMKEADLWCRP